MDVYVFPVDSPIDVSCTFIVKYLWAHHTNSARNPGSNIQTPEVMRYILVKLLLLSFFIYLLDTHKYFLLRDTYSFIHSTNQIIYFFCRCVLFFCSRYLQHWLLDCYCHFSFWLLSLHHSGGFLCSRNFLAWHDRVCVASLLCLGYWCWKPLLILTSWNGSPVLSPWKCKSKSWWDMSTPQSEWLPVPKWKVRNVESVQGKGIPYDWWNSTYPSFPS